MLSSSSFVASLAYLALANAQTPPQDLTTAIQDYDDLSLFRGLLNASPQSLQSVVSDDSNVTVLIPNDAAVNKFLAGAGASDVTELDVNVIETFFSYHVLTASLAKDDFQSQGPQGLVIPTFLQGQEYNNRSAGSALRGLFGDNATGQVIVAQGPRGNSARRFRRQVDSDFITLRAGLAQDVQMEAVDGQWGPQNASSFQIVDSVLTPPETCSNTMRRSSRRSELSALDSALNKTGLWETLDRTPNVTCLAPSTTAFRKAGNPQISLGKADLTGALLHHTLKEVTYTSFLEDGQELGTYNNTKVRVHIRDGEIYFNNAKVIEGNVLTNNGLLHILDAVIGPDDEDDNATSTSTGNNEATPSTSVPVSTSTDNAGKALSVGYSGVFALVAGLVLV